MSHEKGLRALAQAVSRLCPAGRVNCPANCPANCPRAPVSGKVPGSRLTSVPAKAKLTDEQVKRIRRRVQAGARVSDLATEYGVNRKTIRRRLDAAELAAAERRRGSAARRAASKRMKRLLGPDYRNPERAPEHRPAPRSERGERRDPAPPSSTARLGVGGVPLFPNTLEGQEERLAYYQARKLNHLPHSLLDYHDVLHGRETPAERRAREGRASGRRR